MSDLVISLELNGHQLELKFKDHTQLQIWIDDERKKWSWINPHTGDGIASIGQQIVSSFDNIKNTISQYISESRSINEFEKYINDTYRDSLIYSDSPIGIKILEIHRIAGEHASIFAYGFFKGKINLAQASKIEHLTGTIMLSFPEIGESSDWSYRLKKERANFRNSIYTGETSVRTLIEEMEGKFQSSMTASRIIFKRRSNRFRILEQSRSKERNNSHSDALKSIKAVEDTYKIAMGLRAHVEYWNKKSQGHKISEGNLFQSITAYFLISLLLLAVLFGTTVNYVSDNKITDGHIYLIIAAGIGSFAAMIFWVGRLLSKLYLSQQHLRHDAEERSVMTEAYLALTHAQAATDEERKIILSALFRSTSDGLIKDDGPPPLSVSSLISNPNIGR